MNRLECVGKSSSGSQKQAVAKATSVHVKTPDLIGKKPCSSSSSARSLPPSVQVSCQKTQKSGFPSEVLNADERSQTESRNITPRVEEEAQATAVPDDKLQMIYSMKAQPPDAAVTVVALPAAEPLTMHEEEGVAEESEEEDAEDEDLKAPVELILSFLRAVMDRDFQQASRLCQMILIFEPENPEASEFLPLIQKKLLEEQEEEQSADGEEEEDDEDDGSGGDEESSQSSSCHSSSSSSSSPSDDDEKDEQPVNRHKPCPPSHICP